MKRIIAFVLCTVLLCTFSAHAAVTGGENYVLFSSEEVIFPTNPHIAGDSNGDGKVNVMDVITSIKYISGTPTGSRYDSVDINGDGVVSLIDTMFIIKHILGEDVGLGKIVG